MLRYSYYWLDFNEDLIEILNYLHALFMFLFVALNMGRGWKAVEIDAGKVFCFYYKKVLLFN